jgi:hypothetical protein
MKRAGVVLCVVAALILATGALTMAAPRKITGGILTTNDTGVAKEDFHLVITSDTDMNFVGSGLGGALYVNGILAPPPVVLNNNTHQVTLSWTVPIPAGATIFAAFVGMQEEENWFTFEGYFTPVPFVYAPALGWRVTCCGCVFLKNANRARVQFSNLAIYRPSDITLDSMLALAQAGSFDRYFDEEPVFSLSGGAVRSADGDAFSEASTLYLDCFDLDTGDFLLATLEASFADPGFLGTTATILIGHEHQAPWHLRDAAPPVE